jgi:hypothetical protein
VVLLSIADLESTPTIVDNCRQVVVRRDLKRRYVLAFFSETATMPSGIESCASARKPRFRSDHGECVAKDDDKNAPT